MSASGSPWDQIALMVVIGSPMYVVLACGFLLALLRRQRHPRAALFVALGTGLLLLNYIGSSLLYGWLFSSMRSIGASTWATSSLLRIVQSGISAVAFAFLIAAAFVDRTRPYGEFPAPEDRP
ncbi:MAG: hypothetical protein U0746_09560 [Gemmataceae bacterium]